MKVVWPFLFGLLRISILYKNGLILYIWLRKGTSCKLAPAGGKWGKKTDGITDEFQDIVVIENKLSEGTRLTTNQNGGKAASSLEVRSINAINQSPVSGLPLPQNSVITTNNKWMKIFDSENGDAISDIIKL